MAIEIKRRIVTNVVPQSKALRRSVLFTRNLEKQAEDLQARDAADYSADIGEEASQFTRRDNVDVNLDESQEKAIHMMMTQQYGVITGSAGTGKTTTMKKALAALEDQVGWVDWLHFRSNGRAVAGEVRRPAIGLGCFTNIAARNLASKLDPKWSEHCMSIHSMLAFAPVEQEDFNPETGRAKIRFEPQYHRFNPLPLDIIIIDEAGIVSRDLWQMLWEACKPTTRIYFLGDLSQLPALKGVSPMPFAIEKWPTVVLDKIYRQADGSPIIENLTRIRKGLEPVHDANYFRCGQLEKLEINGISARKHIAGYISALYKRGIWDPRQDMIISPQNETMLGQENWNLAFHNEFNKPERDENGRLKNPPVLIGTAVGGTKLCVGDKVMATDNGGRTAVERRFVNGSIGIITAIKPNPAYTGDMSLVGERHIDNDEDGMDWNEETNSLELNEEDALQIAGRIQEEADEEVKSRSASHIVTVVEQATGEVYELSRSGEVASLAHAYAVTAHKFQGSQARNVIVICHTSMNFGLNREWLYTACSRAQERVFLLYEPKALARAVARQQIYGRTVQEKAARLREIYVKRPWAKPELPEPKAL